MSYINELKMAQFLAMAESVAELFSTCSKAQCGAIIVDDRNRILGVGYNGVPSGMKHCMDGGCPRLQENSVPGSDYSNCYANHAEMNAVLNSFDLHRAETIYVNRGPCFWCAKMLATSPIKKIVFMDKIEYNLTPPYDIMKAAEKEIVNYDKDQVWLKIGKFCNARDENQLSSNL